MLLILSNFHLLNSQLCYPDNIIILVMSSRLKLKRRILSKTSCHKNRLSKLNKKESFKSNPITDQLLFPMYGK